MVQNLPDFIRTSDGNQTRVSAQKLVLRDADFQLRLPRWLILINCAGEVTLLYLIWAYWHPNFAAAIGWWRIPIYLAALVTEMHMVQQASTLIEAELESDPELSPFRGPLYWLIFSLGFALDAPAYAMAGLHCLGQLSGG